MRKQILAVALAIMTMSAIPAYASSVPADPSIDWVLNPNDYKTYELRAKYGTDQWDEAEAVEQAKRWAENNKGDIPSIADEKARYEAIVTKVCDFLTYDLKYKYPHIAYTIRDGKGVCADYTTLTKALCDTCNVQARTVFGFMNGDGHNMLKVTLNGKTYYSDPTNYDSKYAPMLMENCPSYFQIGENTEGFDDLLTAARTTGGAISADDFDIQTINDAKRADVPTGYQVLRQADGTEYIVADADLEKLEEGSLSYSDFFDKYNIPYEK